MPQPNDDLFEDSRMSFGDHLEELRSTLVKALISLAIGVGVGLFFAPTVVQFLQMPVENAIRQYRISKARAEIQKQYGFVPASMEFQLSEYEVIPKRFRINPADLVTVLQAYRPDMFPGEVDELEFTGLHLPVDTVLPVAKRLTGLALEESSEVQKLGLQALVERLNQQEADTLKTIAALPLTDIKVGQQVQVLAILNRLMASEDLYKDPKLDAVYAADKTAWLTSVWNSFWQKEDPSSMNGLGEIRKSFEEKQDAGLRKQLNRALIERYVVPTAANSQYQEFELWEPVEAKTQSLGTTEAFMIFLKAAVLAGFVVAGPLVFYFVWNFVAAGLYPQEQKYVYFYMPFSILLFAAGVSIAFVFAFEPVLKFLFSFNQLLGIDPQPQIGQWLSFVLMLPLGFGIAFQLPIVMLLLFRIGIVSVATYISQWKIAVLVIAFLSMVLTPADPISMMLLGVPLTALYGFGILLCRFLPANKRPYPEGYDPV